METTVSDAFVSQMLSVGFLQTSIALLEPWRTKLIEAWVLINTQKGSQTSAPAALFIYRQTSEAQREEMN